MTRHLVIFLKDPRPGRVKTRLAAEIGPVAAAWWFRHQALGLIRRLGRDPRWTCRLALAPEHGGVASRAWPRGVPRISQGRGDLGARMARVLRILPPGPALIVGGDIPDLSAGHVARTFETLGRNEAVLGPAEDGGYWAVGLKRGGAAAPAGMFSGVRWSSEHALADTVASLRPLRIGFSEALADVDTVADLTRLCGKGGIR